MPMAVPRFPVEAASIAIIAWMVSRRAQDFAATTGSKRAEPFRHRDPAVESGIAGTDLALPRGGTVLAIATDGYRRSCVGVRHFVVAADPLANATCVSSSFEGCGVQQRQCGAQKYGELGSASSP